MIARNMIRAYNSVNRLTLCFIGKGLFMAKVGIYNKGIIKTPHIFEEGQKVLIVPIASEKIINERKVQALKLLKERDIPSYHGDIDVNKIREERLKRYEIDD